MSYRNKIRVGVIRGGISDEYDVSLKTGDAILSAFSDSYHPVDILITKDGVWHIDGIPVTQEDVSRRVDVVFNCLHGAYGEDGRLQRALDTFGLPYTGSTALSSALTLNKLMAKEVLKDAGIKMPKIRTARKGDDLAAISRNVFEKFMFPVIAKPVSSGSSAGVTLINGFNELESGLRELTQEYDLVVIEEYIKGKEASCGVVQDFRDEDIYILPVVEVDKQRCSNMCPSSFTKDEKRELGELAQKVHKTLGLRHYSRSDFIVTKNGIYFLEINALPALGKGSPFTEALESIGSSVKEFVDHAIRLAMNRE